MLKWHYLHFTDKKIYIHTKPDWKIWGKDWLRAPDVEISSCLLTVVARRDLSHPTVTLKVRLGLLYYRYLFVSALAKPH